MSQYVDSRHASCCSGTRSGVGHSFSFRREAISKGRDEGEEGGALIRDARAERDQWSYAGLELMMGKGEEPVGVHETSAMDKRLFFVAPSFLSFLSRILLDSHHPRSDHLKVRHQQCEGQDSLNGSIPPQVPAIPPYIIPILQHPISSCLASTFLTLSPTFSSVPFADILLTPGSPSYVTYRIRSSALCSSIRSSCASTMGVSMAAAKAERSNTSPTERGREAPMRW